MSDRVESGEARAIASVDGRAEHVADVLVHAARMGAISGATLRSASRSLGALEADLVAVRESLEHADRARAHAEQTLREVREVLGAGDDECVVEVAERRMEDRDALMDEVATLRAEAQRERERAGRAERSREEWRTECLVTRNTWRERWEALANDVTAVIGEWQTSGLDAAVARVREEAKREVQS